MSMPLTNYNSSHIDDDLTEGTDGNLYVLYENQKEDYVCSKCNKVPQTLHCVDDEVICEQCKLMLPDAEELPTFNQKKLSRLNVVCPNRINRCNRGSQNPIALSELPGHRGSCEYEIIECEFQDLGCKEKLPRVRMSDHILSCKFRNNADVTRFFKETKAGQEELKQKGSLLLSEVDLLRTKIKEQDGTIKDLQAKLESVLKMVPENNDLYWENASSCLSFVQHNTHPSEKREEHTRSIVKTRCIGSLNNEEVDYTIDGLMFCKILGVMRHNNKTKSLYLSMYRTNAISYPISGLNDSFNYDGANETFQNIWYDESKLGKGQCNWVGEIIVKLAELIESNSTLTNIRIGLTNFDASKEIWQILGKAISKNLVLEELSFPIWGPSSPLVFHVLGPFVKKNRINGGKLKIMNFWAYGLRNNAAMKSELDQFQMLLKYQL